MEKEPQKEKGPIARIVKWWFLLTAVTVLCFILSLIAVVADWGDFSYGFVFLGIFFIILHGLFLLIALFTRQWGQAIGILGGILATIVVGFFCAILTAVGQHHPPKLVEDDMVVEDSLEVVEDSLMEVAPDSISP